VVHSFDDLAMGLDTGAITRVVLRRQDGAFVATFSARGATTEAIVEAAKEDYRELVRVHRAQQGEDTGPS